MRPEDRELVERMRSGEREAFGEIYRKYSGRVYAFAVRRLGDPCEAEDVTQDTFVELSRSIGRFEGRSALSTWILGIANHEVSNRRRRMIRRPQPMEVDERIAPAAAEPGPEQRLDAARALARCTELLDTEIGPAHREMFALHMGGAPDMGSIAETVGKSRQAVKISLFRTRRQLAHRIENLGELLSSA